MRARTIVVFVALALLAFLVVLIARLPVRWVVGLLPAQVSCGDPAGSLWRGQCGRFAVTGAAGPMELGRLDWTLRPAALLRASLAGEAILDGPRHRARALFEATPGGDLELRETTAQLPLDARLLRMLPANWTGRLELDVDEVVLRSRRLASARGTARALDVIAQGPQPDNFGSHELKIAPVTDGTHRGQLRDLGGPLEVEGTLVLRPDLSWQVDALLRARPGASDRLARLLEYLGPPDAQGRRTFSAAGDAQP
jgi:general secretion pathway protein N